MFSAYREFASIKMLNWSCLDSIQSGPVRIDGNAFSHRDLRYN